VRISILSRTWSRLAAAGLLLVALGAFVARAAPGASVVPSTAGGLNVFVGYAEDKEMRTPDPAAFPVPWAGSPNTIFLGGSVPGGTSACGTVSVCYDAGAIRLDNPTGTPITVNGVSVDDHSSVTGGKVFANLWGSFNVPGGQSAILTENAPIKTLTYDNFDTSSYPSTCTPLSVAPTITLTVNGVPTTLTDTQHVLDTGGIDVGSCKPAHNESLAWRRIGTSAGTQASITLGPQSLSAFLGATVTESAQVIDAGGEALPNVPVDFNVVSGPDSGTHATAYTDAAGTALFSFSGATEGEDVVGAAITTVGTFSSNTSTVTWLDDSLSGWTSIDVGGATPPGTTTVDANAGAFYLQGGGTGFGTTTDSMRYAYKQLSTPGGIAARVRPPQGGTANAASGVVMRSDTTPNSAEYGVLVAPDGTTTVSERAGPGTSSKVVTTLDDSAGFVWVDDRAGTLTTYTSPDGSAWTPVPGSRVAIDLGANPLLGLEVASGDPSTLASAAFDAVLVSSFAPAPLPPIACPAPWVCGDIGAPTPAGSQAYDPNTSSWSLNAGGSDIAGTADQFRLVARTVSGDASVTAHVVSQSNTSTSAKAGVMLRAGTDSGAPNYALLVSPGTGIRVQVRNADGATTTKLANPSGVAPVWLRVQRVQNTFTAYTSADGTAWSLVAKSSVTVAMPPDVLGGLAATSHSGSALGTVVFDNVTPAVDIAGSSTTTTTTTTSTTVLATTTTTSSSTSTTTTVPGTSTTTTLPGVACTAAWTGTDIGSPALAGSDSCDPSTGARTLIAGGIDITGASDQFHYVSMLSAGDGVLTAHIASQTNTSSNAKAGLMFRASTDAGAPNYAVLTSPGAGIKVQIRTQQSGLTTKLANPPGSTPVWLRIVRSGTSFSSYTSADGAAWTLIPGSTATNTALAGTILQGLAETSHNSSALCAVVYDVVSVG
jgi:hypothetical protein